MCAWRATRRGRGCPATRATHLDKQQLQMLRAAGHVAYLLPNAGGAHSVNTQGKAPQPAGRFLAATNTHHTKLDEDCHTEALALLHLQVRVRLLTRPGMLLSISGATARRVAKNHDAYLLTE